MKVEFEIKSLKWSLDAELPKPVIELLGEVATAVNVHMPEIKEVITTAATNLMRQSAKCD